jgi:hypothetical protein
LFEAGQRDYCFYIIKSGQVDIIDKTGDTPKTYIVHGPGDFTGEVAQLTGSPALVSAVARGECDVFEISPEALHQLLNRHLDLADIILQAFIARRQLLRESGEFIGLRVVGSRDSQDTFRVRDFLAKNRIPFTWIDLDSDPAVKQLLEQFQLSEKDTPVVSWGTEVVLRNPSNRQLADVLGLRRTLPKTLYDLVVVGGGPAGLAAAVYGASEGLRVAVLERVAPGGQAGRSMRIENYLGFPAGISGSELAERAVVQANRFGACLPVATQVIGLEFRDRQNNFRANLSPKRCRPSIAVPTPSALPCTQEQSRAIGRVHRETSSARAAERPLLRAGDSLRVPYRSTAPLSDRGGRRSARRRRKNIRAMLCHHGSCRSGSSRRSDVRRTREPMLAGPAVNPHRRHDQ